MPDEVSELRNASGDADAIKRAIAQIDSSFADQLDSHDVDQVSRQLK